MKLPTKSRRNAKIETDCKKIVINALKTAKNNRMMLGLMKKHYSRLLL